MKTAFICLLITGFMPILCAGIAKWGFRDFDNHNPRHWLSLQTGFRARANAAQANCFEAFPFFVASVVCALGAKSDLGMLESICILFVGFRALFVLFYLLDKATLRTLAWSAAYICVVANFVHAIGAAA